MAVTICNLNNKKLKMFIYNKRRTNFLIEVNINYIVILLFYLLCSITVVFGIELHTKECSAIKMDFMSRGFNASDLLPYPVNAQHLRICSISDKTCCSEATETKLAAHSKQQYEKVVKESLSKLYSVLNTRAQRFDDIFRDMLTNSKRGFHDMFKKTYGTIYVQNSYVFTDLFEELEKYYSKGTVHLTETMDNFFSILYQRMFTVINSQYILNDKYLSCVADHMKELRPFGDVPHKLSIQLKRSLVATRTFVKALGLGSDVTKNMLSIKTTQECTKSLLRMQNCAGCAGQTHVKACSSFCINVMKGCLSYHASLDEDWNSYIHAMDKVADRLLSSFNIEMVVEPIDLKISEAIMNFQENSVDISQRVFLGCGKPVLGRRRRSTILEDIYNKNIQKLKSSSSDDISFEGAEEMENNIDRSKRGASEIHYETYKFDNKNKDGYKTNAKGNKDTKQNGSSLEKLIKDIRKIVKESKRFWSNLPYQICNNEGFAEGLSKSEECWNGTAISRYLPHVVGDGLNNQKQNPSVIVDTNKQNGMHKFILNEQSYNLKAMTIKLSNAFQGRDVEWSDDEELLTDYASGSGSGDSSDDRKLDIPDEEGSGDEKNIHTFTPEKDNIPPIFPPIDPILINKNSPKYSLNITSNEIPDSSGSSKKSEMTLTRAMCTYLFPIVVIWFGGMVADLL